MGSFIRLIGIIALVALIGISIVTQNALGQILTAVWHDAAAFCERQPAACHQSADLANGIASLFSEPAPTTQQHLSAHNAPDTTLIKQAP